MKKLYIPKTKDILSLNEWTATFSSITEDEEVNVFGKASDKIGKVFGEKNVTRQKITDRSIVFYIKEYDDDEMFRIFKSLKMKSNGKDIIVYDTRARVYTGQGYIANVLYGNKVTKVIFEKQD